MFEQLNIYIIRKAYYNIKVSLSLLCLSLYINPLLAQETEDVFVKPLSINHVDYPITNLYVWAAGSYESLGKVFSSYKSYKGKEGELHRSYISMGVGAESKPISFDIGYRLGLYAYDVGWSGNSGVYAHCLTADIRVGTYDGLGIKANFLLGTHTNNLNQSGYEGFNGDCFRRFNWGLYYGYKFGLTDISIEVKAIWWFTKPLIANKVAFYNMEYTRLNDIIGLELKLSYRLFTNGQRRINSSHFIETIND